MPRINRLLRQRENRVFDPECTQAQILLWGAALVPDGPGFKDWADMRQVWLKHRDELLRACGPGERPCAYFEFDLGVEQFIPHWHQQLALLMSRNLITEEEAQRVEIARRELSSVAGDYSASFEHVEATGSRLALFGLEGHRLARGQ
jgi:hypothetical protein